MAVLKSKEIYLWFGGIVLAPIFLPLFYVWLITLFFETDNSGIFSLLWNSGVYVFLSSIALISLIPHSFDTLKLKLNMVVLLWLVYGIVTFVVLSMTCFLYVVSLKTIPSSKPPEDTLLPAICVTVLGVSIATLLKCIFLHFSKNEDKRKPRRGRA